MTVEVRPDVRPPVRLRSGRWFAPVRPHGLGTVCVIVRCDRDQRHLTEAVTAALDQPDLDVAVVILDQASSQGGGLVGAALAAADPRVRVVGPPAGGARDATYASCLQAADADAEWVVVVSADDLLTRGALSRAAALMVEHPTVGFVYGRARPFAGEPPRPVLDTHGWLVWSGREWIEARCRQGDNVIATPGVVMRGSVARRIGDLGDGLPHGGDLEMWLRAAAVAEVGYVVGPDQALHRGRPDDPRRTDQADGAVRDLAERWSAFHTALTGADPWLVDGALEAVRVTLATEALDRAAGARGHGADTATVHELETLAARLAQTRGRRLRHQLVLAHALPRWCARALWLPFGVTNRIRVALRRRRVDAIGT